MEEIMKRYLWVILLMLLFTTACSKNSPQYDEWKDTISSFGDGTYQMLHQNSDGENTKILTNCKHNQCVLTKINSYIKKDDYVYFIGHYYSKKVFCKLNISTNMLSYFFENNNDEFIMVYLNDMIVDKQIELLSSYDEFSEIDKNEFETLIKQTVG